MLGITYILYITVSMGLTVWVGRTLNKNGKVFLGYTYPDRMDLVDAISNMLLVGFYLINIGFIAYYLRITTGAPGDWAQVIEFLAVKIGLIAILLGVMHFALMFVLQRYSTLIGNVVPKPAAQDLVGKDAPAFDPTR